MTRLLSGDPDTREVPWHTPRCQ